jgi:aminoglycoside 2'-N-acetyltransferase I
MHQIMTITYITRRDHELDAAQFAAIRAVLDEAFEFEFADEDNDHANGGIRIIALDGDQIVGHAALIARTITIAGTPYTAGYVEGVAVVPHRQGQGIGAQMMQRITDLCGELYPVSMLSTGEHGFYAKFGWQHFAGESYVDDHGTITRTADEDEGLMVYTALTHLNQADVAFVCDWRTGDVW